MALLKKIIDPRNGKEFDRAFATDQDEMSFKAFIIEMYEISYERVKKQEKKSKRAGT